jgi:broad specificity phosphatase PhoE
MQKRLVIIRHAQTAASSDKGLYDIADPDSLSLNAVGVADANAIGKLLKSKLPDPPIVVSSPSKRCQQTAAIVASHLGVPEYSIITIENLRAQGWGREQFPGRRALMRSWSYPDGLLDSCFPGGESGWQARARGLAALSEILALPGQRDSSLVVTHGFMLRCILGSFLGWTPGQLNQSARVTPGGGVVFELECGAALPTQKPQQEHLGEISEALPTIARMEYIKSPR